MGSEGYLINQFLAAETNLRTDHWGGDFERRCRFPEAILSRMREAVGKDFLIMYRLSMLDLVAGGSNWEKSSAWRSVWSTQEQTSSTQALVGMRPAFPPSPPWCRAEGSAS